MWFQCDKYSDSVYFSVQHLLYRDMKKTSNIEAYVEWFNRLSYLVATEICVVSTCAQII